MNQSYFVISDGQRFLCWKGFLGSIELSAEDGVYFGKVQDIRALVSYEGATLAELKKDFCDAVDAWLEGLDNERR